MTAFFGGANPAMAFNFPIWKKEKKEQNVAGEAVKKEETNLGKKAVVQTLVA